MLPLFALNSTYSAEAIMTDKMRWSEEHGKYVCVHIPTLKKADAADMWLEAFAYAKGNMTSDDFADISKAMDEWRAGGGFARANASYNEWRAGLSNLGTDELEKEHTKLIKAGEAARARIVHMHIISRMRRNAGPAVRRKQLNTRLSKEEYAKLEKAARMCDTTVSDFVRMAIENEIAEVVKEKGNNQ